MQHPTTITEIRSQHVFTSVNKDKHICLKQKPQDSSFPWPWRPRSHLIAGARTKIDLKWSSSHLDEEVPRPEPRLPCHSSLIHRLQVLQGGEGRRWSKLLNGRIRCTAREDRGSDYREGRVNHSNTHKTQTWLRFDSETVSAQFSVIRTHLTSQKGIINNIIHGCIPAATCFLPPMTSQNVCCKRPID